jgi:hypothetical protein
MGQGHQDQESHRASEVLQLCRHGPARGHHHTAKATEPKELAVNCSLGVCRAQGIHKHQSNRGEPGEGKRGA